MQKVWSLYLTNFLLFYPPKIGRYNIMTLLFTGLGYILVLQIK